MTAEHMCSEASSLQSNVENNTVQRSEGKRNVRSPDFLSGKGLVENNFRLELSTVHKPFLKSLLGDRSIGSGNNGKPELK